MQVQCTRGRSQEQFPLRRIGGGGENSILGIAGWRGWKWGGCSAGEILSEVKLVMAGDRDGGGDDGSVAVQRRRQWPEAAAAAAAATA